ncbi:16S rRNA (uracil(1498)-N(3))-methyltransferase [Helicobacter monodelphidis]|uniref:16S rRNA (uracil(1498)-N(3))-methyltransferase n=1 Tax=Helicobacter sp. 15-1451 TaxID=2004995 RepID=UPI0015EC5DA2|nr:RsmE family RNA methyltransferase [Helicobacter sp. 15-1451]
MQFCYHQEAGATQILLEGEKFRHIYKSRRSCAESKLWLRNLRDDFLYAYRCQECKREQALLILESQHEFKNIPKYPLNIALAMIEPKNIEKILPFLNEMGCEKLILFWADLSQRHFRIDEKRLQRILHSSSEQCGRSDCVQLEILPHLQAVFEADSTLMLFDFEGKGLENIVVSKSPATIAIGPEGGFSPKEKQFAKEAKIQLICGGNLILRSETAATYIQANAHLFYDIIPHSES